MWEKPTNTIFFFAAGVIYQRPTRGLGHVSRDMNPGGRRGISKLCSICIAKVPLAWLYNIIKTRLL